MPKFKKNTGFKMEGPSPFLGLWDEVKKKVATKGVTKGLKRAGMIGSKFASRAGFAGGMLTFGKFLHKNKVGQKSVRGIRNKGNRRMTVGKI